ncbi:MAG: heparinase II/III family protein [Armatimonadetes bacterium]|nr:heparinase II/III family protein [Armatimonadota bacterium]
MASYAPDGGWNEGPGYWNYATSYTVYLLAALDTALGTDFGLTKAAGLDQAGDFRLHFVGPSGEVFNYADAGAGAGEAECLFWLGRRYGKPLYYWQEHTLSKGKAFDLAWFQPGGTDPERGGVPLDALFNGVQVGFLRGSWSDPKAAWLAFKGGDNRANHSHLDLGCFVLDALGQRFFCDLGGDDYNLPGYFGGQRWNYYRLRTEGQNCLVIDGQNQNTAAKAPIVAFHTTPTYARAVVDLSAAYPMARRVQRGYALLGRRDVLLVDEIEADQPVAAVWGAHSAAQITVDGTKAVLERAGQRLHARLLSPAGATFAAGPALTTPPQRPLNGITKLTVALAEKATITRIAILLSPVPDAPTPDLTPLADWR